FDSNHTKPATAAPAGWRPKMLSQVPPLVEKVGGPNWWKVGVGSTNAAGGGPLIPANSTAILYMGTSDTAAGPFWLTAPTPVATVTSTVQGFATAHQPVPLSNSMIGVTAFLQWVVIDPTFTQLGFSEAARFTPF